MVLLMGMIYMTYTFDAASNGMIYVPSFMKIGSSNQVTRVIITSTIPRGVSVDINNGVYL